ncbi:alpha/beta hydrolase [Hyphomonas johnsonii]|uniref:Alpha/beta fold family hydrolase n=1 Tax=Hyphomonas johnsonii MHS-2 TaxID=1280950 RepID=A0A059FUC7_9PROT|nr:alpha/beta hydrolase [Hyphomonas johnsonii]KCZ94096.1 alpha/beta fold family hydrolase [Hyphomonas johnsonii MHS-2]
MTDDTRITSLHRPGAIDPEILTFVEKTSAEFAALSGGQPVSITRRREIAEAVREPWVRGGPEMAHTQTLALGQDGLRVRIHIPKAGAGNGTLFYLHGGGWVMFSIDTHDRLMREYAERTGCAVIGLDYSLSPEHRFPRALDDIDSCMAWLRAEGSGLGLNTGKIILGGDSAGGNLSLATALRKRDRGEALPAGVLLNYAALDTDARPSYDLYDGDPYMLGRDEMKAFWLDYLGTAQTTDPYARPLLANLEGLPPVHLCIAECDILADENRELESRLTAAGVEVSAIEYAGATHSFLEAVGISACADRAMNDAATWMAGILAR